MNFRTAFTYIANFFVLLASFLIFIAIDNNALRSFQVLDLILTGVEVMIEQIDWLEKTAIHWY